MAMFGGRPMPAPSAQDIVDFNTVLRRAGMQPDGAIFNDNPSYSQPQAPAMPSPAPAMPGGMFANRAPASIAPTSLPALDTGVGDVHLKAFDRGGTGDRIARGLGDFANTLLALRGNQGAQGLLDQQAREEQAARAQQEWARRFQMEQLAKLANPAPSATQRTYDWLKSMGRDKEAEAYLQSAANPLAAVQVTDPSTGAVGLQFYPKGGLPGGAASATKPAPAPGAIEDGYRFLGGDPSQESSWQKVQ